MKPPIDSYLREIITNPPRDFLKDFLSQCPVVDGVIQIPTGAERDIMKRPCQFDDDYYPFSIKQNMENFIEDIERYCDLVEKSVSVLKAYLTDSLDRVNPTLDEGYIEDVKELLK